MEETAQASKRRKVVHEEADGIEQARALLSHLVSVTCGQRPFGTFTSSIYDSAWLSIVSKPAPDGDFWLFPECFQYILEQQQVDGTWSSHAGNTDGIIISLAGLLALVTRQNSKIESSLSAEELTCRIDRGKSGIAQLLRLWNVLETVHVGFEVIIPAFFRYLEARGIYFEFPGRSSLYAINSKKLGNIDDFNKTIFAVPTLQYSLESFIGRVNFDYLAGCKVAGSMLGSPASTAAFLMHCSQWDLEAEEYLRMVVKSSPVCGGVPTAYPTQIFEVTWVVSVLHSCGFTLSSIEPKLTKVATEYLFSVLKQQKGTVGFAPGVVPDADGTARCLLVLQQFGEEPDVRPMVNSFETKTHFKTYKTERNPSFTANCNVLLALLHSRNADLYTSSIEKAVGFLCQSWNKDQMKDKWSLSPYYLYMHLAEAFFTLIQSFNAGNLQSLSKKLLEEEVPLMLTQLAVATILAQGENGSWDDKVEVTSYARLTLSYILRLPWEDDSPIKVQSQNACSRSKEYLETRAQEWKSPEHIWIAKVTYGSPVLSEAYCIAATYASFAPISWGPQLTKLFTIRENFKGSTALFARIPTFDSIPRAHLQLASVEAGKFCEKLNINELSIFPTDGRDGCEYLHYVSFAWAASNRLKYTVLSNENLCTIMLLSVLIYQAGEYMKTVVPSIGGPCMDLLRSVIREECTLSSPFPSSQEVLGGWFTDEPEMTSSTKKEVFMSALPGQASPDSSATLTKVIAVLRHFITYVLKHHFLEDVSPQDRSLVADELWRFLASHIDHIHDSSRMAVASRRQLSPPLTSPGSSSIEESSPSSVSRTGYPLGSYYRWVHGSASNSTGCPFGLALFSCLVHDPSTTSLSTGTGLYLRQSISRHLSAMHRQYNDLGSFIHDRQKGNLNSLVFSELNRVTNHNDATSLSSPSGHDPDTLAKRRGMICDQSSYQDQDAIAVAGAAKEDLTALAEFESACLDLALQTMAKNVDQQTLLAFRSFITVTDILGQMRVLKDLEKRNQVSKESREISPGVNSRKLETSAATVLH